MEHLNLVKYAGDYWVTLASCTNIRNTAGYSNLASVKSAIRTFAIKEDPSNYVAFRGEQQIKNIVQENMTNPLFNPEEFKGITRAGLINYQIMGTINERFAVDGKYVTSVKQFMKDADEFIRKDRIATNESMKSEEDINSSSLITSRSIVLKQLRAEVNNIEKTIQTAQENKQKLMAAINSLETLSLVDMH